MRRVALVAAGVALVAALVLSGLLLGRRLRRHATIAPPPPPHATLPPSLRALLKPRMQRHAAEMQALTDAVVMMDNPRVAQVARALLADPDLAQPLSATAHDLPPDYRELEQAFIERTRALAEAGQAGDDDAVAQRHAELAITCARCHEAFRR